jgi:Mn2+/Fe2+ NRAMP family transporter
LLLILLIEHLINRLFLVVGTQPAVFYLNVPLLFFSRVGVDLTVGLAEFIGLSIALQLVGLIAVLTVEAIRRIGVFAFLVIEVNETPLGVFLDGLQQHLYNCQLLLYLPA